MPEPFVTIADAAYVLSVDPVTIRRWIAAGRLKAVRVGGHSGSHSPCRHRGADRTRLQP